MTELWKLFNPGVTYTREAQSVLEIAARLGLSSGTVGPSEMIAGIVQVGGSLGSYVGSLMAEPGRQSLDAGVAKRSSPLSRPLPYREHDTRSNHRFRPSYLLNDVLSEAARWGRETETPVSSETLFLAFALQGSDEFTDLIDESRMSQRELEERARKSVGIPDSYTFRMDEKSPAGVGLRPPIAVEQLDSEAWLELRQRQRRLVDRSARRSIAWDAMVDGETRAARKVAKAHSLGPDEANSLVVRHLAIIGSEVPRGPNRLTVIPGVRRIHSFVLRWRYRNED